MPVRLKVCCITTPGEALLAISAGASLLGLVGAMPSGPGPIADETICEIARTVPPGVTSVLLTSETTPEGVLAHVMRTNTAAVQLVDRVEEGTYELLRSKRPSLQILQVIHVVDESAIDQASMCAPFVDALLLDSGRPNAQVRELGGTGRTHDWNIARAIVSSVSTPVLLAGGITPSNVEEAVKRVRPWGIDLCSGVRRDGALDPELLHQITRGLFGSATHLR